MSKEIDSTVVPAPRARAREERGPRLTREQLDAWAGWTAPEWAPFKEAWLERGLRMPPTSEQRALLWEIADARPTDLGRWVRESKLPVADRIVEHVLTRWRRLREAILEELNEEEMRDLEVQSQDRSAAKRVLTRVGEVLRG